MDYPISFSIGGIKGSISINIPFFQVGRDLNSALIRRMGYKRNQGHDEELFKLSQIITGTPTSLSVAGFFSLDRGIYIPVRLCKLSESPSWSLIKSSVV